MITVSITLDSRGVLSKVIAEGHSGFGIKGQNIVCAAATTLLRTAARLIEATDGVEIQGGAEKPGFLGFEISDYVEQCEEYLRGIAGFLIKGVDDLEIEFPKDCKLKLQRLE